MAESISIPPAALRDSNAINIASLWIAEQALHCNLKVGIYAGRQDVVETHAWGTILADFVRHLAGALEASGVTQEPRDIIVNRIWTAFHEELSKPDAPAPNVTLSDNARS